MEIKPELNKEPTDIPKSEQNEPIKLGSDHFKVNNQIVGGQNVKKIKSSELQKFQKESKQQNQWKNDIEKGDDQTERASDYHKLQNIEVEGIETLSYEDVSQDAGKRIIINQVSKLPVQELKLTAVRSKLSNKKFVQTHMTEFQNEQTKNEKPNQRNSGPLGKITGRQVTLPVQRAFENQNLNPALSPSLIKKKMLKKNRTDMPVVSNPNQFSINTGLNLQETDRDLGNASFTSTQRDKFRDKNASSSEMDSMESSSSEAEKYAKTQKHIVKAAATSLLSKDYDFSELKKKQTYQQRIKAQLGSGKVSNKFKSASNLNQRYVSRRKGSSSDMQQAGAANESVKSSQSPKVGKPLPKRSDEDSSLSSDDSKDQKLFAIKNNPPLHRAKTLLLDSRTGKKNGMINESQKSAPLHHDKMSLSDDSSSFDSLYEQEIRMRQNDFQTTKLQTPSCLIDPNSKFKIRFDFYIMAMMLFIAIVVPWRMAFIESDDTTWIVINAVVDLSFLVDIILTFITATFDEKKMEMITDKKQLAKNYIWGGWFFLDLLSIFPFELFFSQGEVGTLARFTRIGKIYRLIRILRMIKMVRIFKDRKKIASNLDNILKISSGMERLTFFLLFFVFFLHFLACMWLYVASFYREEMNWVTVVTEKYKENGEEVLDVYEDSTFWYMTSLYFISTTVTTVGYGDILASNTTERVLCTFMMVIGVCGFTFASGTLSSIISSQDNVNAALQEKLLVLNKIRQRFPLSDALYNELNLAIKFEFNKKVQGLAEFMENLPHKLKVAMALEIHKDIAQTFSFFKDQPENQLMSWIGHRLVPRIIPDNSFLFQQGEILQEFYFLQKGRVDYIIPRFKNSVFYRQTKGDMFGVEDIIYNFRYCGEELNVYEIPDKHNLGFRRFTAQTPRMTEVLCLSMEHLKMLGTEFPLTAVYLFQVSEQQLKNILKAKDDKLFEISTLKRLERKQRESAKNTHKQKMLQSVMLPKDNDQMAALQQDGIQGRKHDEQSPSQKEKEEMGDAEKEEDSREKEIDQFLEILGKRHHSGRRRSKQSSSRSRSHIDQMDESQQEQSQNVEKQEDEEIFSTSKNKGAHLFNFPLKSSRVMNFDDKEQISAAKSSNKNTERDYSLASPIKLQPLQSNYFYQGKEEEKGCQENKNILKDDVHKINQNSGYKKSKTVKINTQPTLIQGNKNLEKIDENILSESSSLKTSNLGSFSESSGGNNSRPNNDQKSSSKLSKSLNRQEQNDAIREEDTEEPVTLIITGLNDIDKESVKTPKENNLRSISSRGCQPQVFKFSVSKRGESDDSQREEKRDQKALQVPTKQNSIKISQFKSTTNGAQTSKTSKTNFNKGKDLNVHTQLQFSKQSSFIMEQLQDQQVLNLLATPSKIKQGTQSIGVVGNMDLKQQKTLDEIEVDSKVLSIVKQRLKNQGSTTLDEQIQLHQQRRGTIAVGMAKQKSSSAALGGNKMQKDFTHMQLTAGSGSDELGNKLLNFIQEKFMKLENMVDGINNSMQNLEGEVNAIKSSVHQQQSPYIPEHLSVNNQVSSPRSNKSGMAPILKNNLSAQVKASKYNRQKTVQVRTPKKNRLPK